MEAEKYIIASLLIDTSVHDMVFDNLLHTDFSDKECQNIFKAAESLRSQNMGIDIVTLSVESKLESHILFDYANKIGSTLNIDDYIIFVKNASLLRQLQNLSLEISLKARQDEAKSEKIILHIKNELETLQGRLNYEIERKFSLEVIETIDEAIKNKGKSNLGLLTGFKKFDQITLGLTPPDLIILAAGPGEGKSTFALNIAQYVSKHKNVIFFSLEMKQRQLIWKMLSNEHNVQVADIRRGNFDYNKVLKTELTESKIRIFDRGGLSIDELCTICRFEKKSNNTGLIIIDYLQLLRANNTHRKLNNRNDEVTVISNKLKQLAMELDVPILALSQLNRDKNRKRYTLADLRDSGSLEQDADNVIFIFRPFIHNMDVYYLGNENVPCGEHDAIINIEKWRLGTTGEFKMRFNGPFSRFEDESINYGNIIEHGVNLAEYRDDEYLPF
jgi:replicative DNA helicase